MAGSLLVWLFAKHLSIRHMMGGGVLLVALGVFPVRSFVFVRTCRIRLYFARFVFRRRQTRDWSPLSE